MKSVLDIIQETVDSIGKEIQLEYEKEFNQKINELMEKYKIKLAGELTRYCSSISFEMSQRFDRSVVELKVVLPDERK